MTIRHVLAVVILAMLGWPATAAAQTEPSLSVGIQHLINEDGTGSLFAGASGLVTWEACPPAEPCHAVASRPDPAPSPVLGGRLDVGNAAVGTVFVATTTNGSQTGSARSSPYLGPARSITPPAIEGKLRVGALIKPVAGTWSGGWGGDHSYLQTQICRFANGTGCVVVADDFYWDKCPGAGAVLTFNHAGRYVRVIDWRITRDTAFRAIGLPLTGIGLMQPAPARAATIAGPIAPASGPPESTCGLPPPRVKLAAQAIRRGKRIEIGRVTCPSGCRVRVSLVTCLLWGTRMCPGLRHNQKRIHVDFQRTFPGGPKSGRLLVPYRQTPRVGPGLYNVSVSSGTRIVSNGQISVARR